MLTENYTYWTRLTFYKLFCTALKYLLCMSISRLQIEHLQQNKYNYNNNYQTIFAWQLQPMKNLTQKLKHTE